jgi:hypothetical protein
MKIKITFVAMVIVLLFLGFYTGILTDFVLANIGLTLPVLFVGGAIWLSAVLFRRQTR